MGRLWLVGLLPLALLVVPAPYDPAPSVPLPEPSQLEDGDLVFRRTESGPGRRMRLLDPAEFTHVGMLVLLRGEPWVVHVSPRSQGNPGGITVGEPLAEFLHARWISRAGVFRVPELSRETRAAAAREAWRMKELGLPFDEAFDLETADRLYCTELVWRAYLVQGIDLARGVFDRIALPFGRERYLFPSRLQEACRRLS